MKESSINPSFFSSFNTWVRNSSRKGLSPTSGITKKYPLSRKRPSATKACQFGGSSLTIANTAQALSVEIEDTWTFSSDVATVTFSPNTIVTRKNNAAFAFYEMVNQEVDIHGLPIGSLNGKALRNLKFGIPGIRLDFSKPVDITINVGVEYEDEILRVLSLVEGGSNWTEENNCTVTQGVCSFSVIHASYFSTVYGMYGDVNKSISVTLEDVILSLQLAAGNQVSQIVSSSADVNGDNHVGIEEAIYGMRYLSGLAVEQ